ncbi:MAG: hypothetical protein IJM97_02560 [Clostridia bacterium]|nr:hypothetical protein [Clostridia bacterium]
MKKAKYLPSFIFLAVIFTLTVLFFVLPKADYSENEKRYLKEIPKWSFEDLLDGKLSEDIEAYLADHFPLRNLFVGINSYYSIANGTSTASGFYHGKDGYLIADPTDGTLENIKINIRNFDTFAKKNNLDASIIIVPSTGYVSDEKLPRIHKEYKDGLWLDEAKAVSGDMKFIDIRSQFKTLSEDAQLYYKTDHHLTSKGSYELYKIFAEEKGFETVDDYRIETVKDFYGTSYSSGGYWLSQPDNVELWHNDDLKIKVEIPEKNIVSDSLFFRERLNEADKYQVFLDGVHSYEKITNEEADGGKLLLIKDSYAHCVAPFLAQHYSEIYMIDMRSYLASVSKLVEENEIDEVLFLYGINNLAEDSQKSMMLNLK